MIFLLVVVLLYWKSDQRFRVPLLLITSYVFYMSWSPPFGLIYGPVIFLDSLYFYWLSRWMVNSPPEKQKQILIFGITTELLLLGYFKYTNFLLDTLEHVFHISNLPAFHLELDIFLPLAISFTNFILISYLVDVYRGNEKPDPSFTRFATYVAFFPHLIAGPIVRASELLRQFDTNPPFDWQRMGKGFHLFWLGFGIKVFVADQLGNYVNLIYGDASLQAFDTSWIATYSFAIQIFTDFWGYTLMAQGSALMLGYVLPENFLAPYFALNISDFWRRWHISLSSWLKDYLYIPLGGSRCSKLITYRNLFITMGLGGLWHGASWNFVIWGVLHGMYLSLHKFFTFIKFNKFIPKLLAWLITFHVVCIAWVFFRARGFSSAWHIIQTMSNPKHLQGLLDTSDIGLNGYTASIFIVGFMLIHWLCHSIRAKQLKLSPLTFQVSQGVGYAVIVYCLITMQAPAQEFIYFQF